MRPSADIGTDSDRAAAQAIDPGYHILGCSLVAGVVDHHGSTRSGKSYRDRRADPFGGTGDYRDLVVE